MSAHCRECITCQDCGGIVACLSEWPISFPCDHGEPICSECWPGTCVPCIEVAEREAVDAC